MSALTIKHAVYLLREHLTGIGYRENTIRVRIPMKVATHSESKITTANTFSFRNYAVNQVAAFVQNYLIFPFSLNLL
jgi:hypothetical protein